MKEESGLSITGNGTIQLKYPTSDPEGNDHQIVLPESLNGKIIFR